MRAAARLRSDDGPSRARALWDAKGANATSEVAREMSADSAMRAATPWSLRGGGEGGVSAATAAAAGGGGGGVFAAVAFEVAGDCPAAQVATTGISQRSRAAARLAIVLALTPFLLLLLLLLLKVRQGSADRWNTCKRAEGSISASTA